MRVSPRSFRFPASSLDCPDATRQPCDQAGEHAPNLCDFATPLFMKRNGQQPEIPRKKKIILKFVGGAQGVEKESPKVGIAASARPLRDVGWDRDGGAADLIAQRPNV